MENHKFEIVIPAESRLRALTILRGIEKMRTIFKDTELIALAEYLDIVPADEMAILRHKIGVPI